jgi:hypothetical protein
VGYRELVQPMARDACIAAGMDDIIAKPLEPKQFFATVLKWLEHH